MDVGAPLENVYIYIYNSLQNLHKIKTVSKILAHVKQSATFSHIN